MSTSTLGQIVATRQNNCFVIEAIGYAASSGMRDSAGQMSETLDGLLQVRIVPGEDSRSQMQPYLGERKEI